MTDEIAKKLVAALELGACDVRDHANGSDLIAHQNVRVEYDLGTSAFDGSLEISCRLRVMTPDGPGPLGNTWILKPEFLLLWDELPEVCWGYDDKPAAGASDGSDQRATSNGEP